MISNKLLHGYINDHLYGPIATLFSKHSFALMITGLSVLCWGGLLTLRGIWWDDWAWAWHYFGSNNFTEYIEPFQNLHKVIEGTLLYFFYLFSNIFKYESLLLWNIIKYIIFICNSVFIFYIVKNVIKEKTLLPETIAVVYLISPVVNNACLVVLVHHFEILFFLLSIWFSIKAILKNSINKIYYILAILCASCSMMALGSFIFIDVIRFVIIFYILYSNYNLTFGLALRKSMLFWLPFMLLGAGIIIDAALRPQLGVYANEYKPHTFSFSYINLIFNRYYSSLKYFFAIYFSTAKNVLIYIKKIFDLHIWHIIISIISFIYVYFLLLNNNHSLLKKKDHILISKKMVFIAIFGLFMLLAGIFPYAMVRGPIAWGVTSRFGIIANLGVSLFLSSVILALFYWNRISQFFSYILFAIVIFSSVFQCRTVTSTYHTDWEQQRNFWWQMAWRVPDIKNKTFLLIDLPRKSIGCFGMWAGTYSFSAPLNLIYAKSENKDDIRKHFSISLYEERLGIDHFSFSKIKDKEKVEFLAYNGVRRFHPKNLIVASMINDCLEINDEIKHTYMRPYISNISSKQISYNNTSTKFPMRWIIGPEPEHNWIYYYQKAMALLGNNDYGSIINLYYEIEGSRIIQTFPAKKLTPFIKSFYQTGNVDLADKLLLSRIEPKESEK